MIGFNYRWMTAAAAAKVKSIVKNRVGSQVVSWRHNRYGNDCLCRVHCWTHQQLRHAIQCLHVAAACTHAQRERNWSSAIVKYYVDYTLAIWRQASINKELFNLKRTREFWREYLLRLRRRCSVSSWRDVRDFAKPSMGSQARRVVGTPKSSLGSYTIKNVRIEWPTFAPHPPCPLLSVFCSTALSPHGRPLKAEKTEYNLGHIVLESTRTFTLDRHTPWYVKRLGLLVLKLCSF